MNMMRIKNKGVRITIIAVIAIILILMLLWYTMSAYIFVHSVNTYDYQEKETRFIAHRGLSSQYFQNTYQAFYYAEKSDNFGGIECDIWLTKDNVWVCAHDNNPFADETVLITENNYDDIKNLSLDISNAENGVNTNNATLTTFIDYLKIMRYSNKIAVIELKKDYDNEDLTKLVKLSKQYVVSTRLYFSSFNFDVIEKIREQNSYVRTMLFSNSEFNSYLYMEMGYNVGYNKKVLEGNKSRIGRHHDKKSLVNVYTVNTEEEALKYIDMGVDYITTDYEFDMTGK